MKIKCTRDSKWNNTKGGGPQNFKQGQVLVIGEDVNEFRAEEMLRCDYAVKADSPIVEETKKSEPSEDSKEEPKEETKEEKPTRKRSLQGKAKRKKVLNE